MKVSLLEISEFITDGTHGSPERTECGVPVLSAQNIRDGRISYETPRHTSEAEYLAFKRRLEIRPGDVLLTIVGSIGRAAVVRESRPAVFQRSVAAIRPKLEVADPAYLLHLFHSPFFQNELIKNSNQSSQAGVYLGRLGSIEIPLPPLEEQRRIALILDKAAEISAAKARRANLLKLFPASLYIEMFGDPKRNPMNWPVRRLGEICHNEDSRRVPVKSSDRKTMKGRYPYYGASGIIDHVNDYLFDGERLLVGEDGANLLARSTPIAFIASGQYWVNNHAHVLSENGIAKLRFLENYFALVDLKPFITGSAQPKLTRSALDSLLVPLPPIDLQERYNSILDRASVRFSRIEASEECIHAFRNSSDDFLLQLEVA